MGLITGIWLVLLGVLGAANIIVARRPDAGTAIARLTPYQGWIGAFSALGGVWGIISALLSLGLLAKYPVYWVTLMAAAVLQAVLGLLLGAGVLKTFIRQQEAVRKLDQTLATLAPMQGKAGLAAIGVGLWMVIVGSVLGP